MLGDINDRAAIFTTDGKALQHAHGDQQAGRRKPNLIVVGQQADGEGRKPHDDDGHQEGVLAPDDVTDPAEHNGSQRANNEAGRERQQREDEANRRIGL